MITPESIARLKEIVDIVEVVGGYIELRKAGVNYAACCPFHDEKTPSFIVSPQKGYFKCYGCGVGGDSITFLMQKENISFYEAVEKLADMYNFTLDYTSERRSDNLLNDLLERVNRHFQSNLNKNAEILAYLQNRGISSVSIERFALGYADNSPSLISFLNQEKLPFDKLLELGIIGKNERGFYSKFQSRIMFPINAQNGKIVGFGGRVLSGTMAKYINSPQSKIFNKSQLLYGYNLAKESIFKEKKIIITEGYIDVVMMHQAGFKNAVATLGTALTKEHLPLLSKGDVEILLCYDGDNAGINAALKASLLLSGKSGGVVIFKDGKDPADMVNGGNLQELIDALSSPTPFIEFIIEKTATKYALNDPLQKEKALKEMLGFFATLTPILQDEYRPFIANALQIAPYLIEVDSKNTAQNATKSQNQEQKKPKMQNTQSTKIVEEMLIKAILENHCLLDFALEYVSAESFIHNKNAFKMLLAGDFENAELIGIVLNDKITTLDTQGFKEQLRLFIISGYTKRLNALKLDKKDDFATKIERVKSIQEKLNLLKRGNLIRLES